MDNKSKYWWDNLGINCIDKATNQIYLIEKYYGSDKKQSEITDDNILWMYNCEFGITKVVDLNIESSENIIEKYKKDIADIYSKYHVDENIDRSQHIMGVINAMAEFALFYKNNLNK